MTGGYGAPSPASSQVCSDSALHLLEDHSFPMKQDPAFEGKVPCSAVRRLKTLPRGDRQCPPSVMRGRLHHSKIRVHADVYRTKPFSIGERPRMWDELPLRAALTTTYLTSQQQTCLWVHIPRPGEPR